MTIKLPEYLEKLHRKASDPNYNPLQKMVTVFHNVSIQGAITKGCNNFTKCNFAHKKHDLKMRSLQIEKEKVSVLNKIQGVLNGIFKSK